MASTPSASRYRYGSSGKTFEDLSIAAYEIFRRLGRCCRRNEGPHRSQRDRAAFVHRDVDLIAYFQAAQLEQRGVEDQALRVADPGDGFEHAAHVKRCFTPRPAYT